MSLEERVQRLEDIEQIKKLKARYCYYCDAPYDADSIAELFVEDGVWDGGETFGKYVGKENIRKFFKQVRNNIIFGIHSVLTPDIEVKESQARGTWYLWSAGTYAEAIVAREKRKNVPYWAFIKYDDDYLKVDGKWKFKSLKVNVCFMTPYELGWEKQRYI